jgi:hypothetical protein
MNGSKALGIVGCEVLEDEIVHVVGHDPEVSNVILIDDKASGRMERKIHRVAPEKRVSQVLGLDGPDQLELPEGISALIWVKPIELHQSAPLLREQVLSAMKCMEPYVQSFMVFYGQCGHAFRNVEQVLESVRVPVTLLRGSDNCMVDDCTGTLLGGSEEYREFLIGQQGAYVLNTMWAANWKEFMQDIQMLRDPNDVSEIKEVFRYMDYQTAIGLDTGLVDQAEFDRQLEEFASTFGMKKQRFPCSLKVVERSYLAAKERLALG